MFIKARYPVSQCKTPVDDHLLSCLALSLRVPCANLIIISSTTSKPPIHPFSPRPLFPPPFNTSPDLLPPKRTPLRQPRLPTRRLAQHGRAAAADDDGLRVREDGRDGEAAGAFDVHEEGARGRDEGLELVLPRLGSWSWIEKVDCENHLGGFCLVLFDLCVASL